MIPRGEQRQGGQKIYSPDQDPGALGLHTLSLPSLPPDPSLDTTKVVGLIAIADTAKRLNLHPLSNLIFAHVSHALGDQLSGKLFIEERTVQGYLPGRRDRYYDLFSVQLSEPKAYLCIPYPLVNPAMALHFEAIAQPTPQVIHARKFPWTTAQERNAEAKKLIQRFLGHFSDEEDLRALITTADKVLEYWESQRSVRLLHDVAVRFFKGKLPAPVRELERRN